MDRGVGIATPNVLLGADAARLRSPSDPYLTPPPTGSKRFKDYDYYLKILFLS
jgi:hypothetical protein